MKKIGVLIEDLYNELEFWYPYLRLKEEGFDVIAIGPEKGKEYKSKVGLPKVSEEAAKNIKPEDLSAIVVPGGYAPDRLRRSKDVLNLVKGVFENGGIVATICHGGWVLISAGILKGKKATSFFAIKDDMVNAGVNWVDEEVVVDGNLITSRVPDDLPIFLKTIISKLK